MENKNDLKVSILNTVDDLVSDFLYYDRKEDENLPRGAIEEAIKDGVLTEEDIINKFQSCLHSSLVKYYEEENNENA